jgi:hypothetical protein
LCFLQLDSDALTKLVCIFNPAEAQHLDCAAIWGG